MSAFKPVKIVHVELAGPIEPLPSRADIRALSVVFWWRGIPLGQAEIPASQIPMSAIRLNELALKTITPAVGDRLFERGFRAPLPDIPLTPSEEEPPDLDGLLDLDRPLETLAGRLPSRNGGERRQTISVVVCTRDRPDRLARCLKSLGELSESPLEIVVVDNAPTSDSTERLVAGEQGVVYVTEPRPGLSAARNRGIRESRGDIIAFTDDDVVVHPAWLTRLSDGFADPDVSAVTGLVLPAELDTEAQCLFEYSFGGFQRGYRVMTYDSRFFDGRKERGVPVWKIGAGANMALRREAFSRIGLFDERLGAGASGCSEDSELWYRILAGGRKCLYESAAVVFHSHRADGEGLKRQMVQYMRGHVTALLIQFEKHGHRGNLFRAFCTLPRYYAGLLFARLRGARPGGSLLVTAQIIGAVAGVGYYLRRRLFGKGQRLAGKRGR
jgi:GT2 family glycosyltransferase